MLRAAAMASATLRSVQEALDSTIAFLEPFLPLANSCMVSFITEDLWRRLVPGPLAAALQKLPRQQLLQLPGAAAGQLPAGPLDDLVRQLCRHRLSGSGVLSPAPAASGGAPLLDRFFSDKKLHEVERLAATVASLAADAGIGQVVDMGSGKGYLSSMLALHYGLNVIAVDAEETNNHGAKKVNANLRKSWDAIVSRTSSLQLGAPVVKRSRKWKRQQKCSDIGRHQPAAGSVTAVDQFVWSGTQLSELLARHGDPLRPLAVVGLHTCGDLAAHSLRMFTQLPQARLLVNVGCCYHKQRERFEGEFWREMDLQDVTFPLSRRLLEKRYLLGRQARLLAAQAAERMAEYRREPSPSLYWRAVVEVVVRDKLGSVPGDVVVGRLAHKASSYLDYMHRALSKFPLGEGAVPDAELLEYHDRLLEHRPRLEAFSVLRACLAPVVEAVVLLDRLAFLLEQESIASAQLVQLFDPVTSPRCYAIIATKRDCSAQ